jgi:hypothetical protein
MEKPLWTKSPQFLEAKKDERARPIRILTIDDHHILLEGIECMIKLSRTE